MRIEDAIMQEITKSIDLSGYQDKIQEAIKGYFESDSFKEDIEEALHDEGLGYNIGHALAKDLSKQVPKALKVSFNES